MRNRVGGLIALAIVAVVGTFVFHSIIVGIGGFIAGLVWLLPRHRGKN